MAVAVAPSLEERALAYLEELRWLDGVRCPRCDDDRVAWIHTRSKWGCRACRYQFRVTAGTVLHNAHLPFSTWLAAVDLIAGAADGFPATQLQTLFGGSYKSFWFAGHRIRAALAAAGDGAPCPCCGPAHDALWSEIRAAAGTPEPPAPEGYAAGAYHRIGASYRGLYAAERRWRADGPSRCSAVLALLAAKPVEQRSLAAVSSRA